MRLFASVLAGLGAAAVSLVFADPPASAPTAPAAPTSASAPAAAAAAPSSTAPSATDTAKEDAAQARRLRAAGFHAETQNGTKVWCRTEANTGSRLAAPQNKVCGTADQLDANAKETQERLKQDLNQQHNVSGH